MQPITVAPAAGTVASSVELRHVVMLLILGTIWGSSYLFIKLLVDVVSPSVMVAVRFGLGSTVLGGVLLARGGRLPAQRSTWLHLLVMSTFSNVLPFMLIAWGSRNTESALAAVLNATTPLFTLIAAVAVFKSERITLPRVAGVVLGLIGVGFLTGSALLEIGSAVGLGTLALLFSSFCYGFGFAYARQFVRGNPLSNVTAQLIIGLVIMTPVALATGWVRTANLHAGHLAAWFILGVFGTGLAYIFYYYLIGQIGATSASLVTYVVPVVGVILGWLVLDEYLGISGLTGMLLIVSGVAISYGWHKRLLRRMGA